MQRQPSFGKMKTAAAVLLLRDGAALWGHIGDSRIYRFADGEVFLATKDHSVTYKKYLGGEISYRDISGDEDRSSLLAVLGNAERCAPEIIDTYEPSRAAMLFCYALTVSGSMYMKRKC